MADNGSILVTGAAGQLGAVTATFHRTTPEETSMLHATARAIAPFAYPDFTQEVASSAGFDHRIERLLHMFSILPLGPPVIRQLQFDLSGTLPYAL